MSYDFILPSLFNKVVEANSQRLAIKYLDKEYTYTQLDRDSNLLASALLDQGVNAGDVVAIINSKNYLSYALMLACLKIGVTYTNIDPNVPIDWLMHIVNICNPKKIYTDELLSEKEIAGFIDKNLSVEELDKLFNLVKDKANVILPAIHLDGETLAYIMFTSGSTGKPKGVAITHQSLIHFIYWTKKRYQITPNDIFANVSPMYFDNSVFDFYSTFFSGACIAPIKKEIVAAPKNLVEYVDRIGCTIWFSVPSLLIYLMMTKVLNSKSFEKLRVITFGGEGYPKSELKKLYDLFGNRIKFINVYGPTECTCICSSYEISKEDFLDLQGLSPLGIINQNISYVILDDNEQLSKKGELCLLGPNVAIGYYNDAEKTVGAFKRYTGNGHYQKRMYCTGDLVEEREGLLYFIGRKDNQIKHMGYRIELETIEIALNKIDKVNEAVVTYLRTSSAFGKIVAFIGSTSKDLTAGLIKANLSTVLPEYMIPNRFEFFEILPKNANGKIDRTKLKQSLD